MAIVLIEALAGGGGRYDQLFQLADKVYCVQLLPYGDQISHAIPAVRIALSQRNPLFEGSICHSKS